MIKELDAAGENIPRNESNAVRILEVASAPIKQHLKAFIDEHISNATRDVPGQIESVLSTKSDTLNAEPIS